MRNYRARTSPWIVAVALAAVVLAGQTRAQGLPDIVDTLDRILAAVLARPNVTSAQIDTDAEGVVVVLTNGREHVLHPRNLAAILARTATEDERAAEVAHFVGLLDRIEDSGGDTDLRQELPRLRLAIVPTDLDARVWADVVLVPDAVPPGLAAALVLDDTTHITYLTASDVAGAGIDTAELSRMARDNLRNGLGAVAIEERSSPDRVVCLHLDGFLDCSLLALPDVWNDLSDRLDLDGAACPARGLLYAFKSADAHAVAGIAGLADRMNWTEPYPVSPALYRWTADGWQAMEP